MGSRSDRGPGAASLYSKVTYFIAQQRISSWRVWLWPKVWGSMEKADREWVIADPHIPSSRRHPLKLSNSRFKMYKK